MILISFILAQLSAASTIVTSLGAAASSAATSRAASIDRTKLKAQTRVCGVYNDLNGQFRGKFEQLKRDLIRVLSDAVNSAIAILPTVVTTTECTSTRASPSDYFLEFINAKKCIIRDGKTSAETRRESLGIAASGRARAVSEVVNREQAAQLTTESEDTVLQSMMLHLAEGGLKRVENLLTNSEEKESALSGITKKLQEVPGSSSSSNTLYTCSASDSPLSPVVSPHRMDDLPLPRCDAYDGIEQVTAKSLNAVLQLEGNKVIFLHSESLANLLNDWSNPLTPASPPAAGDPETLDDRVNKLIEELRSPDLKVLDEKEQNRLNILLIAREVLRGAVTKTQRSSEIVFKFEGVPLGGQLPENFGSFTIGKCTNLSYGDNRSFMAKFLECIHPRDGPLSTN